MRLTAWMAAAGLALVASGSASAQQGGPFAPQLIVNNSTITNYELSQRQRFLAILGAPDEVRAKALDMLVEDRLRMQAAKAFGLVPDEEAVREGMVEFADRANMTPEQMVAALGQEGIAPETFRDFVSAGIGWRQVVGARFRPRTQITEAEIDRAISMAAQTGRGPEGPRTITMEYARYILPGAGREAGEKVRAQVDSCDDLFGVALGQPEDRLIRETRPVAEVPPAIARELARLDEGETSLGLSTPEATVVLMMCGRTPDLGDGNIDREAVRRQLLNRRMTSYADSYLAELRADALIRTP